jgi:hypothetical protein
MRCMYKAQDKEEIYHVHEMATTNLQVVMSVLSWVRYIDMDPILNRDGAIIEIWEIEERIADWIKQS